MYKLLPWQNFFHVVELLDMFEEVKERADIGLSNQIWKINDVNK